MPDAERTIDMAAPSKVEAILKSSSGKKSGGIVVSVPPGTSTSGGLCDFGLGVGRYVGIEGRSWPVQLETMPPPLSSGMAQEEDLEACISYWRKIVSRKDCGDAVCLFIGDDVTSSGFVFAGFDCGHYSSECDHFSLVYDELLLGDRLELNGFKEKLNRFCLFGTREDAECFLDKVNYSSATKDRYWRYLDELAVVKVFIHRVCLPESVLRSLALNTETFTSVNIESTAKSLEELAQLLSEEPDRKWQRGWVMPLTKVVHPCCGVSYDSRLGVDVEADEQIMEVVSRFTSNDVTALNNRRDLKTEIHVAMHGNFNPTFYLSSSTIQSLARLNAGLEVEVHVAEE